MANFREQWLDDFAKLADGRVFRGTVTAIAGNLVSVRRGGASSGVVWPSLPRLASYSPAVGDEVIVQQVGEAKIVLGKVMR
jgi:ribosomal protein S1